MSGVVIHTGRTDTTTHRAVLDGKALRAIIGAHIAQLANVDPDAPHVHINVQLSSRMGSSSVIEEGIVTVTIDHAKVLTQGGK